MKTISYTELVANITETRGRGQYISLIDGHIIEWSAKHKSNQGISGTSHIDHDQADFAVVYHIDGDAPKSSNGDTIRAYK